MRRISLVILLFIYRVPSCSAQEKQTTPAFFEGQISYTITIERKTGKYDSLLLQRIIGSSSEFYYRKGDELTITPGVLSSWGLYRVSDNRAYTIRAGYDSLYWESYGGPGPKIINAVITPGKETVLGILCDELKVTFENKTITSYFNRDTLQIDPALHKAKTLTGDDFYAEKKKALSLKFIIDKPDYRVTYTVTKINSKKLGDKLFELPEGLPLVEFK
jgi:hypothetical protein